MHFVPDGNSVCGTFIFFILTNNFFFARPPSTFEISKQNVTTTDVAIEKKVKLRK